jgi:hypothetical protein
LKTFIEPRIDSDRLGIDSWAYNVYKYGLWKKGKNSSVLRRLKMTLSPLYCAVLLYSKHSYIANITRLLSKLKTLCGKKSCENNQETLHTRVIMYELSKR